MLIWQAALALLAAIGFIKLGSLMVLVAILALTVKVLLAVIVAGTLAIVGHYLWQRYKADRRRLIEYKP